VAKGFTDGNEALLAELGVEALPDFLIPELQTQQRLINYWGWEYPVMREPCGLQQTGWMNGREQLRLSPIYLDLFVDYPIARHISLLSQFRQATRQLRQGGMGRS
jgi:hypothetical protein